MTDHDAELAKSFLDDAPWENCEHGNYEFKCPGCWEALIGQAVKASEWKASLEEVRALLPALRTEIAALVPGKRDDRQVFLLVQADEMRRRLFDE